MQICGVKSLFCLLPLPCATEHLLAQNYVGSDHYYLDKGLSAKQQSRVIIQME